MSWYHVIIVQHSTSAEEVRLDYTLEELQHRIIDPYRRGQPLTVNGKTIAPNEIERVTITKSEDLSSDVRRNLQMTPQARALATTKAIDKYLANSAENVTDEFIDGPPGNSPERSPQSSQASQPQSNTREVFVVHGRNNKARDALFAFLTSIRLDPLEWSEAVQATGKATPYIGEILDAAFSSAQAVVVLFTPDDEARLRKSLWVADEPPHETELTGQARPNVLFEAGMAMGRCEDRTVLIELGKLRPFSDIGGRHTIRLDNTSERRQELAQRLESAGCPVNREGTAWHKAGDFEGAVSDENDIIAPRIEQPPEVPTIPPISDDAKELLMDAARNADNTIVASMVMAGLAIHIGDRFFAEPGDRRSEARWKRAIEELEQAGLVEALSYKRQAFQLTHAGFEVADILDDD